MIWTLSEEKKTSNIYIEVYKSGEANILYITNTITINFENGNNTSTFSDTFDYDEDYKFLNMISQYPDILIDERKISMPTSQKIIVEKDTNSQLLTFKIDRYFNGIDLSKKAIGINYITANKVEGKAIAVNVGTDETTKKITFGWLLDYNVSQAKGNVKFLIEILGKNEFGELYRFQSLPTSFTVEEGLFVSDSIVEEQYPTIIEDIKLELIRLQNLIDNIEITGGGGVTKHSLLTNLDYASSGHTGFTSSNDLFNHNTSLNAHQDIRDLIINIPPGTNGIAESLEWGNITGNLENQTDLKNELDNKLEVNNIIAGTGITLDVNNNNITINSTSETDTITTTGVLFLARQNNNAVLTHKMPTENQQVVDRTWINANWGQWTEIASFVADEDVLNKEIEFIPGNRFFAKLWLSSDIERPNAQLRLEAIDINDGTKLAVATTTVNLLNINSILTPVTFENKYQELRTLPLSQVRTVLSVMVLAQGVQFGVVSNIPNEISYISPIFTGGFDEINSDLQNKIDELNSNLQTETINRTNADEILQNNINNTNIRIDIQDEEFIKQENLSNHEKTVATDEILGHVKLSSLQAKDINQTDKNFVSSNIQGAISELFISVSDGKTTLISDITDMGGIVTSSGKLPTFKELSKGIQSIPTDNGGEFPPLEIFKGIAFNNFKANEPAFGMKAVVTLDENVFIAPIPSVLPTGISRGVAWSPDGRYETIAHDITPFKTTYDWISGTPIKVSNPVVLPTGSGYNVAWSPNGRYETIVHGTTPFKTTYDWISNIPVKVSNPAVLPTGTALGVTWSPDGRYETIAHDITPFKTTYDWISGTPVKVSNPAVLPAGSGNGVAWSPNGRYETIVHNTTPFKTTYDWISGTPVKVSNPAVLPTGISRGVAWSPDSRYETIVHDTTPFKTTYDWISGTPIKVSNPVVLPTSTGYGVAWSPDGRYETIVHDTFPFKTTYDWISGTPVKVPNPIVLPTGTGRGVAWSPNGEYETIAYITSPFKTTYNLLLENVILAINNKQLQNLMLMQPKSFRGCGFVRKATNINEQAVLDITFMV